jgi:hypothetical protein
MPRLRAAAALAYSSCTIDRDFRMLPCTARPIETPAARGQAGSCALLSGLLLLPC